jgi:hypothetical protein
MVANREIKGGYTIMQKITLALLLTTLLVANSLTRDYLVQKAFHIDSLNSARVCTEYRFESEKFLKKAYSASNYDISHRYLIIADQFLNKYGDCVIAFNKQQHFQGYRQNPYYK